MSIELQEEFLDDIEELIEEIPEEIESVGILVSRLDESEGAGNVALRQLRVLQDSPYSPNVLTFDAETKPPGANIKEIGRGSHLGSTGTRLLYTLSPISILKLSHHLRSFDLLIIHQPVLCPGAVLAKYLHGTTTIYYNHHITEPSEKVGIARKVFGHTVYRALLYSSSKLDGVVSVSKYSRDEYRAKLGKNGPIIYNKIDDCMYNTGVSGDRIRNELDIDNSPVILYVGRLSPSKRVHELIDIYGDIQETYSDAVLLIVGRNDEDEYCKFLKKKKQRSSGNIIFTGFVPEEELPHYYAAADVYATCSEKEGFNLTIAEAEACGTPAVAYDIGAHSEVLQQGQLISMGDTEAFASALVEQIES